MYGRVLINELYEDESIIKGDNGETKVLLWLHMLVQADVGLSHPTIFQEVKEIAKNHYNYTIGNKCICEKNFFENGFSQFSIKMNVTERGSP